MILNWAKALLFLAVSALVLACPAVLAKQSTGEIGPRLIQQPAARTTLNRIAVDGVLANALESTQQVSSTSVVDQQNRADDQLLSAMQGMLEQLHQLERTLGALAADPSIVRDTEAKTALDEAWLNYEQMASAFQAMTRHLTKITSEMEREKHR